MATAAAIICNGPGPLAAWLPKVPCSCNKCSKKMLRKPIDLKYFGKKFEMVYFVSGKCYNF